MCRPEDITHPRTGARHRLAFARYRGTRPETSENAVNVTGSANDRWLDASSTAPSRGMLSLPAIRIRTKSTTNGHSRSMATEYQNPRPGRGSRAVRATIWENVTPGSSVMATGAVTAAHPTAVARA